jgi:hypothetical protein
MEDLNANGLDAAVKMIEGTCRSMGVDVVETGGGPTPVDSADDSAAADDGGSESAEAPTEGDAAEE